MPRSAAKMNCYSSSAASNTANSWRDGEEAGRMSLTCLAWRGLEREQGAFSGYTALLDSTGAARAVIDCFERIMGERGAVQGGETGL